MKNGIYDIFIQGLCTLLSPFPSSHICLVRLYPFLTREHWQHIHRARHQLCRLTWRITICRIARWICTLRRRHMIDDWISQFICAMLKLLLMLSHGGWRWGQQCVAGGWSQWSSVAIATATAAHRVVAVAIATINFTVVVQRWGLQGGCWRCG